MSHAAETDFDQLTRSLTENFNVLADEVQALSDRKTVLEHKLRFAHEQYQILADKYAPPTDQDVASTLATLQLRPDLQRPPREGAPLVPLPSRLSGNSKQATAEAIRDGRRASQLLASLKGWTRLSDDSNRSASIASRSSKNRISRRGTSSFTTFYEQDFTVPGKKSQLLCPFVQKSNHLRRTQSGSNAGSIMVTDQTASAPDMEDNTAHHSADPICAALYAETRVSAPPSTAGSNKCPIRFLESHSPEDIAKYFETHKHEIPRSHEICVKTYGRNEVDVRKLDAKYGGNLVNMLQGLGQKHQPMLPKDEELEEYEQEKKSNDRVGIWAKNVSQDGLDPADSGEAATSPAEADDEERESRFDRQMKEVRVGESPSRPWGISVPWNQPEVANYGEDETPNSPPAPVAVPKFAPITRPAGVCPFGHGAPKEEQVEVKQEEDVEDAEDAKSTAAMENSSPPPARPAGKCPFSQGARETFGHAKPEVPLDVPIPQHSSTCQPRYDALPKSETLPAVSETHATQTEPYLPHQPSRDNAQPGQQPAFLAHPQPQTQSTNFGATVVPQMVFNGPVFIGYPVDQAMALMQQWQVGMNNTQR